MLGRLVHVKEIREQSALNKAKKCEQKFEAASEQLLAKEKALSEYVDWRCLEEKGLYENILNSSVRQKELDFLKQSVALLREKDAEYKLEIETAEQEKEAAEAAFEEAKEAHRKTLQTLEKFKEFARVQDEEAAKEAERLEELELEEFTVRTDS